MKTIVIPLLLASVIPLHADELRLDARTLFEKCVSQHVELSADGKSLVLERGELIEDDGPAAGFSYKPNEEVLSPGTWIKKELIVPNRRARKATLLVCPGGDLRCTINGREVKLTLEGKVGGYWQAYSFAPDVLLSGKNDFVLHGSGKVYIARDDEYASGSTTRTKHPNRSAKSTDGGKTWNDRQLGPMGIIDGEYCVRLALEQHRAEGTLTSPVFDVGNLEGKPISAPIADVGPVRFKVDGEARIRVRSGKTPIPTDRDWTAWTSLAPSDFHDKPRNRYLQFAVEMTTRDPLQSPVLKEVIIQATPNRAEDWTKKLKVIAADNPTIIRSSIPFVHESAEHPTLKEIRAKYRLDDVVADAKSDFEQACRLAVWSSRRWEKNGHLRDIYPAWNTLDILKSHGDGTPIGGFCQQYNLVFLQACQSFGIPCRAISIGPGDHDTHIRGGHEVVEIWSNEHRKWGYLDGQMAWYLIDPKSKEPLSLRELRQRQLREFKGKELDLAEVVKLAPAKQEWKGLRGWPPFLELRLIPRSNFLQEKAPLPLNQGMRGWFWTGHHVWSDADSPASLIYSQRVQRPGNWDWTPNQVHYLLQATETPGAFRVHLDTETPGFETFVASFDGKPARPVTSGFMWNLHKGKNILEVRSRNRLGRDGIASGLVLDNP